MKTKSFIHTIGLLLVTNSLAQVNNTNSDEDDDDSGIGIAEIIAIVVCSLVILVFVLSCFIIIRNNERKKRIA